MEAQNDHGLLVVSLENCIASETCELGKASSCVYTAAMASGACGPETSVVQLAAPMQCIGDIRQTLSSRMQHQHLTQLQPIQYSQTISYEPSQQIEHNNLVTNHTLYQPMTVSTAPLHTYTTSNPYMNNPIMPLLTPSPSFPPSAPTMEDMATSTDPIEPTGILKASMDLHEPTYPAEGFDYFSEIRKFLITDQCPPNVSENYAKCLKKRAQNYLIINDKLYHKSKQPKEVIMRKDQQEDMLSDIHVVKETGVHLGVKKMFNKLHMKYFWRGMYTDVVNFVKKCDKCSDQIDPTMSASLPLPSCPGGPTLGMPAVEAESEDSEAVEDPAPLSPSPTPITPHRSGRGVFNNVVRVWRKVEVQLHGPYYKTPNCNEYIATMTDPDSRWCCARACRGSGHVESLSDFIFHEFCNFGFARCSLVGCSPELCQAVNEEYVAKMSKLGNVFLSATVEPLDYQQSSCTWAEPLIERLVHAHPNDWDEHIDHFLFQYRIGELKEFIPFSTESPFSFLFYHNPLSFTLSDEDKENIDGNNTYKLRRRKPYSRLLQCRYCDSLFTSKLSFRIHQRKHQAEGHRRLMVRKRTNKSRDSNHLSRPNVQPSGEWKESTVSAVKALLVATKEERRRRGKYHKYSVEVQEQMVAYAMKHGNTAAGKHFSEKLGTVVNESTIRNLVKIYSAFTSSTIDEIGRFAVNYGVEPAAKFFSERLKRDISQSLVRKFKAMYLGKRVSPVQKQREEAKFSEDRRNVNYGEMNRGKRYTVNMKQQIGEYACNHSVKDTMEHFTEKLQMLVKERTVRRFHKIFLNKCSQSQTQEVASQEMQIAEPTNCENQETVHVNVYSTFPETQDNPVTLYQLNQPSTGNVCYQTAASASVITSQSNYQTLQNFSSSIPAVTIPTAPPPYPIALVSGRLSSDKSIANIPAQPDNQQPQTCIVPQHSLILTHQNGGSPLLPHFLAAQPLQPTILTLISDKEPQKVDETQGLLSRSEMQTGFTSECYQGGLDMVTELMTHREKQKTEEKLESHMTHQEAEEKLKSKMTHQEKQEGVEKIKSNYTEYNNIEKSQETKKQNIKRPTKKKDKGSKKRGTYTTYSPEIRAEIGKFAAEHGSLKACQHFAKILGHDVPESTARGLREKYLMKKRHCQVTSLGYSQRGRPLRLGKYDELVQECIKDLVRSGEKVSSFLAITTAKEILNKYEPELLEENGGSLKLNVTWAKSFLKRIGVHNNS